MVGTYIHRSPVWRISWRIYPLGNHKTGHWYVNEEWSTSVSEGVACWTWRSPEDHLKISETLSNLKRVNICKNRKSILGGQKNADGIYLRAGEDRQKIDLDQRSRSKIWSRSKIKITQDHLQWSRSITRSKIKINYYIHWKLHSTCRSVPRPKSVLTDKMY